MDENNTRKNAHSELPLAENVRSSGSDSSESNKKSIKTQKVVENEKRRLRKILKKEDKQKRKLEKQQRKLLKKQRKIEKQSLKLQKKEQRLSAHATGKALSTTAASEEDCGVPLHLMDTKARAPETKEQYEARQSVLRRIVDPETGRTRLIKGDGEIVEECVSRERHQEINRLATANDGAEFQRRTIGLNVS
ncbi:ADP-ribosylation factor-like protein 6-interacting protein 4 [Wyeomyia smithii]|uniref:ADP-ribosylation factor-like protein 6-interacting protein 4 n=1 Tax=Wyeomyia smithii TaxID=174621 RepID=UPI002467BDFF|nr:ADP-ribosylation factor-like protein 6-interacting protein 4 [Wyeomyia smithii]